MNGKRSFFRFNVKKAISYLKTLLSALKFLEQRILRHSLASIPDGPAEPFVLVAALKIILSSIKSKKRQEKCNQWVRIINSHPRYVPLSGVSPSALLGLLV